MRTLQYFNRSLFIALLVILVSGCNSTDKDVEEAPVIRGLKGYKISRSANSEVRRYPSVVQPAQESKLSFEVAGHLKAISLEVGQKISSGQVLAEIDPVSMQLKTQQARASLDEANAAFRNAESDFNRKKQLFEKQYVTQSEIDDAGNKLKSTRAQVEQATRQLDLAEEDLSKAQLVSPFDAIVASIDVQDYAQISAGEPILSIYSESGYEVAFSVPAAIINRLSPGDEASISFADLSQETFRGHIKELGTRAAAVSAFPVVVALDESPNGLKAGMAADVALNIVISEDGGFLVPLSSFYFGALHNKPLSDRAHQRVREGAVFIYDPATSTVKQRRVEMYGIRENMVIVHKGLQAGDIVAIAGVSYLYDGQEVNLLPLESNQ